MELDLEVTLKDKDVRLPGPKPAADKSDASTKYCVCAVVYNNEKGVWPVLLFAAEVPDPTIPEPGELTSAATK